MSTLPRRLERQLVGEGTAADGVGHRAVLPSARIAVAASSALSSWLARRSRISRRAACTSAAAAVTSAAAASLGGGLGDGVGLVARAEAQGTDERLDPGPDGGIADLELPLHVAEVAAAAQEALQDLGLLAGQAGEPTDRELALERRPALPAAQPRHRELARADGTGGDDVMGHDANLISRKVTSLF